MRERSARDEDRMKTLDGKLATLLTGVVAAIGFSFRTTPTVVTVVTAMMYLVPLALIVRGLTTKLAAHAPDPDSLERHFPSYPVSTIREAVKAIKASHDLNAVRYERKGERSDDCVHRDAYRHRSCANGTIATRFASRSSLDVAGRAAPR